MNPEELTRLLDAYRDGTIAREDAERLASLIRGGGEESLRILRELQFEGLLGQALDRTDEEAFLRSLHERIDAERGETAFMRAFERRRARAKNPGPRVWGIPAALAAGVLLALLLYMSMTSAPSDPPRRLAERGPLVELPASPPDAPEAPSPRPELRPAPEPPRTEPPLPSPIPLPAPETAKPAGSPVLPASSEPPGQTKTEAVAPNETRVWFVTVTSLRGNAVRLGGPSPVALSEGQGLDAGQGIECGAKGSVTLVFADGTRLELGPETLVREFADRKGKRVTLTRGVLAAQVAKQPVDAPMVFATPHGEARVLGTALRLEVDVQTRLEVLEGRVRLARTGGKAVEVGAGNVAWCGPGMEPVARTTHPEEIVLAARDARIVGDEWRMVADRNASTGTALEVAKTPYKAVDHVDKRPSYAIFSFWASAEVEYRMWLRSTSMATGDRWLREMVTVEPQNCTLSATSSFFGAYPTTAFVFTGVSLWTGYGWSSGVFDETKPDAPPLVVRFKSTGMQTLRVFTDHPSIRIDAVWLSAHQSSRPAAKHLPPVEVR